MKPNSLQRCVILVALAAGCWSASAATKVGFAERDITPEIGMEQPGNYMKQFHQKFHDTCKVRAAVFDDGTNRAAIVGIDALMIPRPIVLAARKQIQARCGIAPEAVMVGASHSHSSGPVGFSLPGDFDHASDLVKKLAYEKSPMADAGYVRRVEQQIVEAVCAANEARATAACSFGSGIEDKAAFNRRIRMKSGVTFTHPGKGNPDSVEFAGPIDPQVGVIGAWTGNSNLVGCIVNYACHATTPAAGISANWIYDMERTIRGVFGTNVIVVFVQGACGDITQVNNLDAHIELPGERGSQLVGGRVGAEALKVLFSAEPGTNAVVSAKAKAWNIKRRVPSTERVAAARALVAKDEKEVGREWIWAKETVLLDALIQKEPAVEVEVQAIQVGPAIFISNPAELFVEYGLELKRGSAFPFTFPVELANGCVGYVPTAEAFSSQGGGYETRLTAYSNLEITAGKQFVETGLDLARTMQPGRVPERPLAPRAKEPWVYGNVPAQIQ
jgi:neutral ceramidase